MCYFALMRYLRYNVPFTCTRAYMYITRCETVGYYWRIKNLTIDFSIAKSKPPAKFPVIQYSRLPLDNVHAVGHSSVSTVSHRLHCTLGHCLVTVGHCLAMYGNPLLGNVSGPSLCNDVTKIWTLLLSLFTVALHWLPCLKHCNQSWCLSSTPFWSPAWPPRRNMPFLYSGLGIRVLADPHGTDCTSKMKIAFTTPQSLHTFLVLPCGLKIASVMFSNSCSWSWLVSTRKMAKCL